MGLVGVAGGLRPVKAVVPRAMGEVQLPHGDQGLAGNAVVATFRSGRPRSPRWDGSIAPASTRRYCPASVSTAPVCPHTGNSSWIKRPSSSAMRYHISGGKPMQ